MVLIEILLTKIMATIGPINAKITPFSVGSQHLYDTISIFKNKYYYRVKLEQTNT